MQFLAIVPGWHMLWAAWAAGTAGLGQRSFYRVSLFVWTCNQSPPYGAWPAGDNAAHLSDEER